MHHANSGRMHVCEGTLLPTAKRCVLAEPRKRWLLTHHTLWVWGQNNKLAFVFFEVIGLFCSFSRNSLPNIQVWITLGYQRFFQSNKMTTSAHNPERTLICKICISYFKKHCFTVEKNYQSTSAFVARTQYPFQIASYIFMWLMKQWNQMLTWQELKIFWTE